MVCGPSAFPGQKRSIHRRHAGQTSPRQQSGVSIGRSSGTLRDEVERRLTLCLPRHQHIEVRRPSRLGKCDPVSCPAGQGDVSVNRLFQSASNDVLRHAQRQVILWRRVSIALRDLLGRAAHKRDDRWRAAYVGVEADKV